MNIKIWLSSASNYAEKQILYSFGKGIQQWISQQIQPEINYDDVVRIGRWNNIRLSQGPTVEYEYSESWLPCDVAVIFGSWKPREKGTHMARNAVAGNAKKFIVIETPLLARRTDIENQYWRIGVNGYLHRDAYWPEPDPIYGEQRLKELGVSWKGWKNKSNGPIVVALQLPGDASLRGTDINDWAYHTIRDIRKHTDKKIIVRNHPLASGRAFADHEELARKILLEGIQNIKFSDGQIVPWAHDLDGAYCTVTYSSGLGIDSIVAGIPTIACDVGNFAHGISTNSVDEINNLKKADEETVWNWLRHLALCQWKKDEMANGRAWHYLLPVLENLK